MDFCFDEKILKAYKYGARGRTRTDTRSPLPDFESGASTSFTTRAFKLERRKLYLKYIKSRLKNGSRCWLPREIISF